MNKILLYLFFACAAVLFSCQKEVSTENNTSLQAAGSLWDTSGNCLPDSVHGTFYNGVVAGSDTAYVEIQVNVTQTGSYNITSDIQNGFEFTDSGFFSSTGINTIRLKPLGAAILPAPTTFNISFDSTFCTFTVNVEDSTGKGLGQGQDTTGTGGDTTQVQTGQWQFTQGSANYAGLIDSAKKDNSSGVATFVTIEGSGSTGDTSLSLGFTILGSDIVPGTYTILNNSILFSSGDFLNDFSYIANAFVTGTDFTITVTSYNTSTKEMKGTFSGSVQDKSGNIVPLTNGSFDVIVQ